MEQILNLLEFTNTVSILWNILAYVGMALIIVAVVSVKWRNQCFVWGPLALLLYACFYLRNPILTGLQLIVAISGILNFVNVKKIAPFIVFALTVVVYAVLLITKQISGLWPWIGSFGLLGIAFGMTQLPSRRGFNVMASGGLLIIVYALALQIWVFFVLNLIFFVANLFELKKERK